MLNLLRWQTRTPGDPEGHKPVPQSGHGHSCNRRERLNCGGHLKTSLTNTTLDARPGRRVLLNRDDRCSLCQPDGMPPGRDQDHRLMGSGANHEVGGGIGEARTQT